MSDWSSAYGPVTITSKSLGASRRKRLWWWVTRRKPAEVTFKPYAFDELVFDFIEGEIRPVRHTSWRSDA